MRPKKPTKQTKTKNNHNNETQLKKKKTAAQDGSSNPQWVLVAVPEWGEERCGLVGRGLLEVLQGNVPRQVHACAWSPGGRLRGETGLQVFGIQMVSEAKGKHESPR